MATEVKAKPKRNYKLADGTKVKGVGLPTGPVAPRPQVTLRTR
jgi:hypothetical protein